MADKIQRDLNQWRDEPAILDPNRWTRYLVMPGQEMWDAIPESNTEFDNVQLLAEWRPSRLGGYGMAAVWVGPREWRD